MIEHSSYLFARPSFWTGFGSCIDLFGVTFEYNRALTPKQADYFAIRSDWAAVGQDIRHALGEFEEQHPDLAAARDRARTA